MNTTFELPEVEVLGPMNGRRNGDVVVAQNGTVMSEDDARRLQGFDPGFAKRAAKANHGNGR